MPTYDKRSQALVENADRKGTERIGPLANLWTRLAEDFAAEHEARYGYRDREGRLELVTIRVTATSPGAEVGLAAEPVPEPRRGRRAAARAELEVVHGPPLPGSEIAAPAVIELAESTVLVPEGWFARVDATGTIRMRRTR